MSTKKRGLFSRKPAAPPSPVAPRELNLPPSFSSRPFPLTYLLRMLTLPFSPTTPLSFILPQLLPPPLQPPLPGLLPLLLLCPRIPKASSLLVQTRPVGIQEELWEITTELPRMEGRSRSKEVRPGSIDLRVRRAISLQQEQESPNLVTMEEG